MANTSTRTSLAERFAAEFSLSHQLHERARNTFPGGVTHDSRYMEPFPIYIDRAQGSRKWSVEGHELVDYWSGHGALLLGHSHPAIVEAVGQQMSRGTHPGGCHEKEIEWGQWVQKLIPSAERVRFVSSGTEATLMALRLARLYTGRPRVLKFAGHFHGWNDFIMPGANAPFEQAVPGVSPEVSSGTVLVPPNDPDAVEQALREDPQIGCVILEPTGGHWGAVPMRGPFLQALRELTKKYDRLLIFDEVITGFRVSPGGAQAHYQVTPDLTTLAKILAGGLPGGCVAGRADILAQMESRPGKPKMYHPGTFNANPLSASAGIACLELVSTGDPSNRANATARSIRAKLNALFAREHYPWLAYGEFSGFRLIPEYEGQPPLDPDFIPYAGSLEKLEAPRDKKLLFAFRQGMLLHGVDSWGLAGMVNAAHTEEDVEKTVAAVAGTLELLREEGLTR